MKNFKTGNNSCDLYIPRSREHYLISLHFSGCLNWSTISVAWLAAALVVWCKKLARQFQLSCAAPHKIKFLLTFNVCKSICYTISYVISESWSQLLCSIEKAVWKLAQSVPFNRSQNVLMYFLKGMHKLCKKYPSRHRNAKLCIKKISV